MKRIIIIIFALLLLPIWVYADESEFPATESNQIDKTEKEEITEQSKTNEVVIINQYTGLQEVIIIDDYTEDPTTDSIPMRPLHLKHTNVTTNSVGIVWDENMGYDKVKSYNVYVNGAKVGNTKTSSYVIEELLPGRKYEITVTALNYYGESLESAPIEVITHRVPIATPKNIRVTNITEETATINWEKSDSQEGLYNIYLNGNFVDSTKNTYYQLDNLNSNTEYNVGIGPDGKKELLTVFTLRTGDSIGQENILAVIEAGFEYIGGIWPFLAVLLGIILSFAIATMILDTFGNLI